MSNFAFIPSRWSALAEAARAAEAQVYAAPQYCAMLCRKSLEEWVRWLYEHDADLELPTYDTSLSALLHQQDFKNTVAPIQFDRLNLIRKLGNNAVHTRARISEAQALHGVKLLHGFIGWVCQVYSASPVQVPAFDEALVPSRPPRKKPRPSSSNWKPPTWPNKKNCTRPWPSWSSSRPTKIPTRMYRRPAIPTRRSPASCTSIPCSSKRVGTPLRPG